MRNEKGFTLMELMIVLAILAIIAAILIPTFMNTTDRARLRSDIQSAHVIHNAMELYRAERGVSVVNSAATPPGVTANMNEILIRLRETGYLSHMDQNSTQTEAVFAMHNITVNNQVVNRVVVDISGINNSNIQEIADALPENERRYIYPPLTP